MDSFQLANMMRKGLSREESEAINRCLEEAPEEFKESFSKGFVIGYGNASYLAGMLEAKNLTNHLEDIAFGFAQRVLYKVPDNLQNHPEIQQISFAEIKDYVNKWEMYNQLFGDSGK